MSASETLAQIAEEAEKLQDASVAEYALPDNSDTRILMTIIFGSIVFLLFLTCFISCCLGSCGKCQGKADRSALYNSTEVNKVSK